MNDRPRSTAEQRVRAALAALAAGEPVVVADDDRENEGDLIFAAELATPKLVAFTVRHTSGFLCVALPGDTCDKLDLVPMTNVNQDRYDTAYQVTVDRRGTGSGISATARAATIAALGSDRAIPEEFSRPGHVVPLRARPGGVLERPGHTEAAVDLARLAGLTPAGALCEIVSTDRPGEMARGDELARFADEHGLVHLSVADIVSYRRHRETRFVRIAEATMPTSFGTFRAVGYRELPSGGGHIALVAGTPDGNAPVYVHTECLCGDIFAATSCACREKLEGALTEFGRTGRGIVVYVRPEGGVKACGLLPADTLPHAGPEVVAASILADLDRHGGSGTGGARDLWSADPVPAPFGARRGPAKRGARSAAPAWARPMSVVADLRPPPG